MPKSTNIRARAASRIRHLGRTSHTITRRWADGVAASTDECIEAAADALDGKASAGELLTGAFAWWVEAAHATCSFYRDLYADCGVIPQAEGRPAMLYFEIDELASVAEALPLGNVRVADIPDLDWTALEDTQSSAKVPRANVRVAEADGEVMVSLIDLNGTAKPAVGLYNGRITKKSDGALIAVLTLVVTPAPP